MVVKLLKETIADISSFGALPFYLFLMSLFLIFNEIILFTWLFIGLILSFAFVIVIRIFYFKERPEKKEYKNLFEKIDASTFPSLHSWRIVMILVFLSSYYRSIYIASLFGIIALLVLFSRGYLKKHYFTDIIFGSLFGLIMALLIIWIV